MLKLGLSLINTVAPYEANTNIYTNSGLGTVFFAKTT